MKFETFGLNVAKERIKLTNRLSMESNTHGK